jgi:KilA-N domain
MYERKSRPIRKVNLDVKGTTIAVVSQKGDDYICVTDVARYKDSERTDYIIQNWLRNRNTIEFLGIWEQLNNPDFNPIEFDGIRKQAGLNTFILTAKRWIESTGAIGLISRPGRYGGTYAHKDIAFEFASWVSVEFKLYLIKEFQRLKEDENRRLPLRGISTARSPNSTTGSIPTRLRPTSSQLWLALRRPPVLTPAKPIFSTSPCLARPPSNDATPIALSRAICAIALPSNSFSCWRTLSV